MVGFQLEALPYATSYIPTNGAIATRLADSVTGAGDATTFNSTEGVLYAEISRSEDEGTYRLLGIDNGTASNYIKVGFSNTGTFWMRAVVNGVTAVNSENIPSNGNQFYKIALKYKSGESSIHIDGTKVVTSATTFSSGNFTDLQFTHYNGALSFYDKVKSLITFDTALTDAELECLTTI